MIINNLNKYYNDFHVLKDINIEIPENKIVGIIGENGAGKTTLIKCILNIINDYTGEIKFENESKSYGYIPEERGLYAKIKVVDQLLFFSSLNSISKEDALNNIDYYLKKFDILDYKNKKVKVLSKGNKQKIQFISALVHNPDFLVLDEPFSGIDPINSSIFIDIIYDEAKKGKTIFFSSHNLNNVEKLCDFIFIIKDGRIVNSGSLEEIKSKYKIKNKYIIETNKNTEDVFIKNNIEFQKLDNRKYSFITKNSKEFIGVMNAFVENGQEILALESDSIDLNKIFIKELTNE